MTPHPPLLGLAYLMRRAFSGDDLTSLGTELMARAERDPDDTNALIDLATVLQIRLQRDSALAIQRHALATRQLYHLPASRAPALRLLVLIAPGDIQSYTPLEFLLEDSDVSLDMQYVGLDLPFPESVPEHDVLFNAINESDANRPLLEALSEPLAHWPRPVLEHPLRIIELSRDRAPRVLEETPGVLMPPSIRISRTELSDIANGGCLPDGFAFPLIVRPVGSHAGKHLERLAAPNDILTYLTEVPSERFYLSPFIDYRSADGQFRKYRVALIGGTPYACHMGISDHWVIHYANAGMDESAAKRAEEARFMVDFDQDFARRHATALEIVQQRFGLDYLILDCAETPSGELLIFELDTGGVIHAMDPPDLYPYKQPQMQKVFTAFRRLLSQAVGR